MWAVFNWKSMKYNGLKAAETLLILLEPEAMHAGNYIISSETDFNVLTERVHPSIIFK